MSTLQRVVSTVGRCVCQCVSTICRGMCFYVAAGSVYCLLQGGSALIVAVGVHCSECVSLPLVAGCVYCLLQWVGGLH